MLENASAILRYETSRVQNFVVAGLLSIYIAHPAYSQAQTIIIASQVCAPVEAAASKIPLTASATDWPITLRVAGVVFPKWTKFDPKEALALEEHNYLAEQEIYWGMASKNDPKFQQEVLKGKAAPNEQDFEKWWAESQFPLYSTALSKAQLESEQTDLSGISGQHERITVFRFRIVDSNRTEIQESLTPVNAAHLHTYNSWQYTFRIYSNDVSYSDYTVGIGNVPDNGEMAIIHNLIFIFGSWDSDLRTGSLDAVLLPDEQPPLMGKELNAVGICNLAIGKN